MFLETILRDATAGSDVTRRPASAVAGRWRNRLGSIMELTVHEDHHLHGTFQTAAGAQQEGGLVFHVAGFAEGDALAFCVDFGNVGSVATWSGHHIADGGEERLVTLWHLARPVRDPHSEVDVWASLLAGSDEFTRID